MFESQPVRPVILFFPFGHLSHYLRCLMLAKHLETYFDIRFAYDKNYAGFVTRDGFQTFECLSLDAGEVLECVKKFDFSWLDEQTLEAVFNDQVRIINALKPVAVLGDTSPTLKMAAEKSGVLYISLMNGYMSKYYALTRKIPEFHPGYKFVKILPEVVGDFMTGKGEALTFYKLHKPFKKIRQRHFLSRNRHYLDELEGDINLICDLNDLFPLKLLPGAYRLISPLFYNSPGPDNNISTRLDHSKKTIYVSMGSTGDWQKVSFLNNDHFKKYNIVTSSDKENVLHASHIITTDFINVHDLFPHTSLVICHGGNGTVYQSLHYAIPVLCKTSHFEQQWNVDAIERCKAGQSIDGVMSAGEHIKIIERWITQKAAPPLQFLMNRINEELDILPEHARYIAGRITPPGFV